MRRFDCKNSAVKNSDMEYVDAYTPEEHDLNRMLLEECLRDAIDLEAIEALLKQGADPLGSTRGGERNECEHIYGEILAIKMHERENIPRLTELFLKYGMDIDHPRVEYDGDEANPLWTLGVALDDHSIETLKLFLDHGISVDSFGLFWSTAMGDLIDVSCGDPVGDEHWNKVCTLSLKATMLAASYDYILKGYRHLRGFIGCSHNDYDVHKFRNWKGFTYKFDTTHCKRYPGYPELYQSVVTVYEIESQKAVWRFGVYLDESEIRK